MLNSTNAREMRIEHPGLAFELETAELEYELTNQLYLQGLLKISDKNAQFIIKLTSDYELTISPMVRSYGGYPVWGRTFKFFNEAENKEVTQTMYHFHFSLSAGEQGIPEFEFEIESRGLGRAIEKGLNHIKTAHRKRFAAVPVVTMN